MLHAIATHAPKSDLTHVTPKPQADRSQRQTGQTSGMPCVVTKFCQIQRNVRKRPLYLPFGGVGNKVSPVRLRRSACVTSRALTRAVT